MSKPTTLSKCVIQKIFDVAVRLFRQRSTLTLPARHKHLSNRLTQSILLFPAEIRGESHRNEFTQDFELAIHFVSTKIRPDRKYGNTAIPSSVWIENTNWRRFLAFYSYAGLIKIPDLQGRYYRTAGDGIVDNLCGIWSIGPSTVYRYIERAKEELVVCMHLIQSDSNEITNFMNFLIANIDSLGITKESISRTSILEKLNNYRIREACWYSKTIEDYELIHHISSKFNLEIAASGISNWLFHSNNTLNINPTSFIFLKLSESLINQALGNAESENSCLFEALKTAHAVNSKLLTAVIQSAISQLLLTRNPSESEARGKIAIQMLSQLQPDQLTSFEFIDVNSELTLIRLRLAWIRIRQGDQAGKLLYQEATEHAKSKKISHIAQATLHIVKAEILRREGLISAALDEEQFGLLELEEAGHTYALLQSYNNLGLLSAQSGNPDLGISYCLKVIKKINSLGVEAPIKESTLSNLSIAYMLKGDFTEAITHLTDALALSDSFGRHTYTLAIHYNLAECHYNLYRLNNEIIHIKQGDAHKRSAERLASQLKMPAALEATQELRKSILGDISIVDKFIIADDHGDAHQNESINKLRESLALTNSAVDIADIQISLATAYVKLAVSSRDAAIDALSGQEVNSSLQQRLRNLEDIWKRSEDQELELSVSFRRYLRNALAEHQAKSVAAILVSQGWLNKSSYGEAAEVSPATASKHLGLLADKGLLEQQGRGPATRYVLPAAASSGGAPAAPPVH